MAISNCLSSYALKIHAEFPAWCVLAKVRANPHHYSYNLPLSLMLRETVQVMPSTFSTLHLQALTHRLMLQLAKEPNFCQRTQDSLPL